jgi:hypothetical protein
VDDSTVFQKESRFFQSRGNGFARTSITLIVFLKDAWGVLRRILGECDFVPSALRTTPGAQPHPLESKFASRYSPPALSISPIKETERHTKNPYAFKG